MFEMVVLSGKGGTGKTTVTAAFAHLADRAVICDLDVDAPDLHLLLSPKRHSETPFRSGYEAVIDPAECERCGQCAERCRFDAIDGAADPPVVDPIRCEGCGLCVHICPARAIGFFEKYCGNWYMSDTRFGPMVHAQLFPGEENSGRLVALLRQEAKRWAQDIAADAIISDGPPGIGCPAISSLSGASVAVIVTEPTVSGIHDLRRVAELCAHFRVPAGVIVNKYDIHLSQSRQIETWCRENGIRTLGRLPFDTRVVDAMMMGRAITECGETELDNQLKAAWLQARDLALTRAVAA